MGNPITGIAGTSINAACSAPKAGELVSEGVEDPPFQSICNDLATIATGAHDFAGVKDFLDPVNFHDTITIGQSITILADGTGSQINGTWTAGGAWTFATGATFSSGATCAIASGGTFSAVSGSTCTLAGTVNATSTSKVSLLGRVVPRSARVAVADAASKAIGVTTGTGVDYAGKRFSLSTTPSTGPNVIVLKSTNAVPTEGETMECIAAGLVGAPGIAYSFQREDTTVVAKWVITAVTTDFPYFTEFEFVSGVWRLGASSGSAWDGAASYGVLAGPGA